LFFPFFLFFLFLLPNKFCLTISAIISRSSHIKQLNFQEASRSEFKTQLFKKRAQILRGKLGADRLEKYFKPCKVEIGKKVWKILEQIVKIHSGSAQFFGFKGKLAVLAVWGSFKK